MIEATLALLAALVTTLVLRRNQPIQVNVPPPPAPTPPPPVTIPPAVSPQDLEEVRRRVDTLQAIIGAGMQKTAEALEKIADAVNETNAELAKLKVSQELVIEAFDEFQKQAEKDYLRKGELQ